MGNNYIHFWGSNGQHKSIKEQGSFILRRIMVKVGLLVGNKGLLSNCFSGNKGIPDHLRFDI